jgi:hypothetical protein
MAVNLPKRSIHLSLGKKGFTVFVLEPGSILEGEGSWFVFGLRITQVSRYFRKGSIKHIIVLHGNTSRYEPM